MENKQIEEIFNQTFGGLALFYRDIELSEQLISKYKVNQILNERGFTDVSYKSGGLSTNFRYLIASANGRDLSAFNPDSAKFGHVLLASGTFFKVLDIYHVGEKTQVLLLDIPSTAVDFFSGATSNIEQDVIKKARENFEKHLNSAPIIELQLPEWRERTGFPIGMSDQGELFYQTETKNESTEVKVEPEPETTKVESMQKVTRLENARQDKNKAWWKFW